MKWLNYVICQVRMNTVRPGTRSLACLLLATLPLVSQGASTAAITAEGYVYGFPLVLMGETMQGLTGAERVCGLGTDLNTFAHVFDRPDASFKAVVRPNVDTLYSSAMLDLAQGPLLLDMPAVPDRYVLMALLDAWSNNFAGVGTQSHGAGEGHYVIVGPNREGSLPDGYERIDAPTNLVWIVGRTEVWGEEDIPQVNAIQTQYRLTPWAHEYQSSGIAGCIPASEKTPPIDVVKSLSTQEFFSRLSDLMILNPPPKEDAAMVRALGQIGVGPEAYSTQNSLSWRKRLAMEIGRRTAQSSLVFATRLLGLTGWGPDPSLIPLGEYGQRYLIRAVVAQVGFGANRGEYAVYQNASRDSRHRLLGGKSVYTMTFPAEQLPPVKAFWSLTAYGSDGFLRDNPVAEQLGVSSYAVGSNTGLEPSADGSITIYMAAEPPAGAPLANWLPTPEGRFEVTIRLYDPRDAILKSEWKTPPIIRQ